MRYSINAAGAAVLLASIVPASAQTSGVVWGGPYGGLDLGVDWGQTRGSVSVARTWRHPVAG